MVQCKFPVANTSKTFAVFVAYFDNTDVSNGAILVKTATLVDCTIKLWSATKIAIIILGI